MGQNGPGCLTSVETRAQRRAMLAEAVLECEGRVVSIAHVLGYSRSHTYLLLDEYWMWALVNRVRVDRLQRDRQRRRRIL